MGRSTVIQTNFTAGEISPQLYGRVDVARYQNGAKRMRNTLPRIYGGGIRRPGTIFVREVKDSTQRTRLIPFIWSADTAYIIEAGDTYLRFFKDNAVLGAPYEVTTPYSAAQILAVDYTHGEDTMFMFHEAVAPYKLVRIADTNWTLGAAAFVSTPFEDPGSYPASTLTATDAGPVGAQTWVAAGEYAGTPGANAAVSWSAGIVTVNKVGHGLSTGTAVSISGVAPAEYNKTAVITVVDPDNFTYPLSTNPGTVTVAGFTLALTGSGIFGAGNVGSWIKINGGLVKLTGLVSTSVMVGIVKQELTSTVGARQDAWSLHAPAWSASRGWPRTGTLWEQRLIAAGSPTFPQTIWGSGTGLYLDFQQGTADDDGFAFKVGIHNVGPIRYMTGSTALLAMTSGAELTVQGGLEKPLAPTNAQIKRRRNHGAAAVRPLQVQDAVMFIQRAGRKVRALGDSDGLDRWSAPDLSVLSEHLTQGGVVDMCWQQEPDSVIWLARADGLLASVTYDRDQEVTAWALHDVGGVVESLASIPTATGDQVWMVVRRLIGGVQKRYIERLSFDVRSDSAVVATGSSSATWSGLGHLEGREVDVVANGSYAGRHTVTAGAVTIARAATSVEIGLPYTSLIELLPPELQTGMGSASGQAMSTSEVIVRFHETTGCTINGDAIDFRTTGEDVLDRPPPLFSGLHAMENLGWERGESVIVLEQPLPMPWYVLSVTRTITVNNG